MKSRLAVRDLGPPVAEADGVDLPLFARRRMSGGGCRQCQAPLKENATSCLVMMCLLRITFIFTPKLYAFFIPQPTTTVLAPGSSIKIKKDQ